MASDTQFLQPLDTNPNPNPNFAKAEGQFVTTNYSHSPSSGQTEVVVNTLLKGGLAQAIAQADAIFLADPAFSALVTESTIISAGGVTDGTAKSQAKVVANFTIAAKETFSLDFSGSLNLQAKEIENPKSTYSQVKSGTAFLVLDTTDVNRPKILDYSATFGRLTSSNQVGKVDFGSSKNINFAQKQVESDIDGNNGTDFVAGQAIGTYQRSFKQNTNITVVEINISNVKLLDDNLINNLGVDVIYGSIWDDKLKGTSSNDKIYASLGNDDLKGDKGDDILEAGQGNDRLDGDQGNDQLHGGYGKDELLGGDGNDTLVGGGESDVMTGGSGADKFVIAKKDKLRTVENDVIKDFEVGIDKIEIKAWGKIDPANWYNQIISQGKIVNTQNGALFSLSADVKLLFEGVNVEALSASDFLGN